MSLLIDPQEDDIQVVARIYTDKGRESTIGYLDEERAEDYEDEDPEFRRLRKIRLNGKDEMIFPEIPDFQDAEQVDRVYIAGESGCGKTTFIGEYIQKFRQKYSKAKVWLISSKTEDRILDCLPIERIRIDEDILEMPLTLEDISVTPCSLAVFDDIEDFKNKKVTAAVDQFLNECIRNGRSRGIFTLYVHHDPCDYKATKLKLFEATRVVTFPRRCGAGIYDYLYEKKLKLNKRTIDAIDGLRSDWVCVNKRIPRLVISNRYILIP